MSNNAFTDDMSGSVGSGAGLGAGVETVQAPVWLVSLISCSAALYIQKALSVVVGVRYPNFFPYLSN